MKTFPRKNMIFSFIICLSFIFYSITVSATSAKNTLNFNAHITSHENAERTEKSSAILIDENGQQFIGYYEAVDYVASEK